MRIPFLAAAALLSGTSLPAAEPCVTLDNKAVAALFDDWNYSLSSLDPNQVVQRYWPNAVLLPTVSNTPRTSSAMIADYFEHFLVKRPRGHIDTRTIQTGCNIAVDMGTYTFSLMNDKGSTTEVAARYTFVYQYRDGAWKILHHHSSAMPERPETMAADAHTTPEVPAEAQGAAKKDKPAPARAPSRRDRRAWMREPVKPVAAAKQVAAAKPVEASKPKPAEPPKPEVVELAKPGELAKPAETAKPTPDAKPASAGAEPAADGKSSPEIRTAMFANLTLSPPPSKFYPKEAASRKERGSVNLKVCANGEGAVTDAMEILNSSGSKLLDEAAMTWAREVTWVPATYNRRRVEGCAKVDVTFEPPPELVQARRR